VRGAVNIPLGQLRARVHELSTAVESGSCATRARAAPATRIAIKAGYDAVNIRGGVIAKRIVGHTVYCFA
jgi:rhodanese-related sulfurtransferase